MKTDVEISDEIRGRLRSLRKSRGQLATEAGVTYQSLTRFLKEEGRPYSDIYRDKLAAYLGLEIVMELRPLQLPAPWQLHPQHPYVWNTETREVITLKELRRRLNSPIPPVAPVEPVASPLAAE